MNIFYYLLSMIWLRVQAEYFWFRYSKSNNMKNLLRLNAELEIIENKMNSLNKRYAKGNEKN